MLWTAVACPFFRPKANLLDPTASPGHRLGYALSPLSLVFLEMLKRLASWIADNELPALALLSPLFLFPSRNSVFGVGAVALLWISRWAGRGILTVRTPMDWPIAVMAAMTLVSLYPSVSFYLSWPKLLGIFFGIFVFYAIVNSISTERAAWHVAGALCLGGLAVALASMVGTDWSGSKLFYLPEANELLPRLSHLMPKSVLPTAREGFNPNEVGGAVAMILPVPLALLLSVDRLAQKAALGLVALVMGATLALTQSRSAFLGLAVALGVLLLWRYRRALLLAPVALAGFLFWAFGVGPDQVKDLVLSIEGTSGLASLRPEDRMHLWWTALQMVQDFPLTGIGLNTFPIVMDNMYPVFAGYYRMPHAHNLFLQTAVDLGIPGLLAFVALLAGCGSCLRRAHVSSSSRASRGLTVGLGCGVLAYLVYGLTDAFTLGAKPGVFFWILVGLAGALALLPVAQARQPASPAGVEQSADSDGVLREALAGQ